MITPVKNNTPEYQAASRCGACNVWPGENEICSYSFPKNQFVTRKTLSCENYFDINIGEEKVCVNIQRKPMKE